MRVGENIWQLFLPDEAFICSELKVLIIATSYTNSEWGNEDKFIKIYLKKIVKNFFLSTLLNKQKIKQYYIYVYI